MDRVRCTRNGIAAATVTPTNHLPLYIDPCSSHPSVGLDSQDKYDNLLLRSSVLLVHRFHIHVRLPLLVTGFDGIGTDGLHSRKTSHTFRHGFLTITAPINPILRSLPTKSSCQPVLVLWGPSRFSCPQLDHTVISFSCLLPWLLPCFLHGLDDPGGRIFPEVVDFGLVHLKELQSLPLNEKLDSIPQWSTS